MTEKDIKKLASQIKRHEGLRLAAYLDTEGILTIGYGHNCTSGAVSGITKPGDRISQYEADQLFDRDLSGAVWDVRRHMSWSVELDAPRQAVLIDMVFNMGAGRVLGFKKALAAMQAGDWTKAAAEMLDSRWARQVGARSVYLAKQMEDGAWR